MKLSVITINYNNIEGLQCTIDSTLAQTWQDFEWIIIDGGSTDGSRDLIEKTANECSNVTYWCSEPDKGVYNAQNKGISHANGEYMNFMNSGDTFYNERVLENVFSTEHDADIVYGDWMWSYPDRDLLAECPHKANMATFYYGNINHQAMFIRSAILKEEGYDENYKVYADWARWMKMACEGKTFEYVPYIICRFEMGGLSGLDSEQRRIEYEWVHDIPKPHIKAVLEDYNNLRYEYDRNAKDHRLQKVMAQIKDRPKLTKLFHLILAIFSSMISLIRKYD